MTKKEVPYPLNRPGATRGVTDAVRKDGIGHYPESITQKKMCCSKYAKIQCCKCEENSAYDLLIEKIHE